MGKAEPRIVSDYVLGKRIGSGATGVVHEATGVSGEGRYAIKLLQDSVGHLSDLRRRFSREARALSKLDHEGVVEIVDVGVDGETPFIVMEFLEGTTLEELLDDDPIEPSLGVSVVKSILEALAYAHERDIVHRDLKPANVFLVGDERRVKVLDFGLAKFLSADEFDAEGTLTRRGRVVGTPAYMAPEQISGISLDVRADVYSCGVLLFELLADRRPFDYERRSKLLRAHLFEPVPRLSDVRHGLRVDEKLEDVIRRALSKDPAQRFDDGAAMLAALEPFDGAAVELVETARLVPRSAAGTSSVLIESGERDEVSSSGEATVQVSPELEADATQADTAPPSASQPWHQAGWVDALVWSVGVGGLAAAVAVMIYATTLR